MNVWASDRVQNVPAILPCYPTGKLLVTCR